MKSVILYGTFSLAAAQDSQHIIVDNRRLYIRDEVLYGVTPIEALDKATPAVIETVLNTLEIPE